MYVIYSKEDEKRSGNMSESTLLGMGMVLVGAIVLIVYFMMESRKQKKKGEANLKDFINNAIHISETISPETKGMGLALVRYAYDLKTTGKNLGKEMTKGIAKGVVQGALTGRARVSVATPNASCDFYIVRYGRNEMYFYNIGSRWSCQEMQTAKELMFQIALSDLASMKRNHMKVTITMKDDQKFIFDIQKELNGLPLRLKDETRAFQQFLDELHNQISI